MDEQRQDDPLEHIYNSSVPIQNIAMKNSQEPWMIEVGGEKGSGRSALAVQHDDDDDIYLYMKVNMDQNPTIFAPVISTNIHCYVNYSDIKVLKIVTETETETFNVDFTS